LLAFQQIQVHRKQNLYASFIAFFSLQVFTDSFLREVFTSPYLVFYRLLLLAFYDLHWIYIFLAFQKAQVCKNQSPKVKVIVFFVKPVSAGSELDLNWNLDRAQTGRLLDYFLVCSVLVWLNRHLDQDQPEKWKMTPMAIFGFPYKMGLLPQCF
jgi:hypothetical protein